MPEVLHRHVRANWKSGGSGDIRKGEQRAGLRKTLSTIWFKGKNGAQKVKKIGNKKKPKNTALGVGQTEQLRLEKKA